ncbi:MAG: hypothetical protein ACRD2A_06310, partial [Vicinamibacterales bacterium]
PGIQCEVHRRQVLRVALSVAIGQTPFDQRAITRVVEQLWAPEGVGIDWIDEPQASTPERLDAWVVVGRKSAEAAVTPRPNVRARIVLISVDEVAARLEQALSLQLQVPRDSVRHLMFGNAHLIGQSLGYAIAHQLGHSVFGLPHASAGLMSADYNQLPGLNSVPAAGLDGESRRILQKRFDVGCVAAR